MGRMGIRAEKLIAGKLHRSVSDISAIMSWWRLTIEVKRTETYTPREISRPSESVRVDQLAARARCAFRGWLHKYAPLYAALASVVRAENINPRSPSSHAQSLAFGVHFAALISTTVSSNELFFITA